MKKQTPKKPEKQKDQISMMWDMLFNGLVHRLDWQDKKLAFIIALITLLIAAMGIIIALVAKFIFGI